MKSLTDLQHDVGSWAYDNFGDNISKATGQKMGSLNSLMGMAEEIGELFHCVLKRHQGIRGYDNDEKYFSERDDAVSDLVIYLLDYCHREGIVLEAIVNKTWDETVSKRNWKANPETAMSNTLLTE